MKRFQGKFVAVAVLAAMAVPGVANASRLNNPPDAGGRCTGRPFELVKISQLAAAEQPRADTVDRNGNGFVCRMNIPGPGQGNTGNNSNIKDDKI